MPLLWRVFGYTLYFWSNEIGEPIHFHIAKNSRKHNDTKFWIYSDGSIHLAHNKGRVKLKDIDKIMMACRNPDIVNRIYLEWKETFGTVKFIK